MEKSVKIDGKSVRFKATGGLMYRYKAQFGRELLTDLAALEELQSSAKTVQIKSKGSDGKIRLTPKVEYDLTKFSLSFLYDLLWTMAKTADESIPPPQDWLDSFDAFPVMDIWSQTQEIITQNFKVDPKNA